MKMDTTSNGGLGKVFGRMFSGENIFQNKYTARGENGMIAFASSFPGSIKAFEVGNGKEYIFQKKAFLAGEEGVNLSVHFNKKFSSGLFGSEGFVQYHNHRTCSFMASDNAYQQRCRCYYAIYSSWR